MPKDRAQVEAFLRWLYEQDMMIGRILLVDGEEAPAFLPLIEDTTGMVEDYMIGRTRQRKDEGDAH